jgi:hypothetical protein
MTDSNPDDDRLDRLVDIVMHIADSVEQLTGRVNALVLLAERHEVQHADYRADIERLYASFSEHLRDGHAD